MIYLTAQLYEFVSWFMLFLLGIVLIKFLIVKLGAGVWAVSMPTAQFVGRWVVLSASSLYMTFESVLADFKKG